MKTTILSLLLFLSLTACSSDDDSGKSEQQIPPKTEPSGNYNELIVGRWDFQKQCETGFGNISCNDPFDEGYFYNFRPDGVVEGNNGDEGSYSLQGKTLILDTSFPVSKQIYRLTQQQLVLVSSGDDTVLYRIFNKAK